MIKKRDRKVGTIREISTLQTCLPHTITHLNIGGINLHTEMKGIETCGADVFQKYEEIIMDLQGIISRLEERNMFIDEERVSLLQENYKLKQELESMRDNCYVPNSYSRKQTLFFEVVEKEQSINILIPKVNKKTNEILEQSELDLGDNYNNGHYLSEEFSPEISMASEDISQQRTPRLNIQHTLIQCKAGNNQAPLRIFYILFLQSQDFIKKIRQIIEFCIVDDSKVLLHLLPQHNSMWAEILQKFLDLVEKGEFENETEIIHYIAENPLIDMLMVSALKQLLPIENEDENLNIGDWKNEEINPKAIFQGLCNEFDLLFEEDKDNLMYKIYPNIHNDKSFSQENLEQHSISEENLLESRTQSYHSFRSEHPVEISLVPRDNNMNTGAQSRQEPIFKIWLDRNKNYYQTNISIRPENFNYEENFRETESFQMTEQSINELEEEEDFHPPEERPLVLKDVNKIHYGRNDEDYLKKCESKFISCNHSIVLSENNSLH